MDDDFDFGGSVWASSSTSTNSKPAEPPVKSPLSSNISSLTDDAFDDTDDFSAPVDSFGDDDEFGDFGDFGDATEVVERDESSQSTSFDDGFGTQLDEWSSLRLRSLPSSSRLRNDLDTLLDPLWSLDDSSQFTTNENIRQVGGLNQVLITQESRSLYNALFQYPPSSDNAPTWIRSRIRRRHLVSLGIPVNLDEVLPPHVNGRNMPALQITTRSSSAPPVQRTPALSRVASPPPASASSSRSGTPKPGASPLARQSMTVPPAQAGLGPRPEVDEARINQLLGLTQETLSLLPLATLEKQLESIRSLTADTSGLLTYLLQQRDALNQDAETYNGLIAELVGEAQKMKSGPANLKNKTRTGSLRRTSNKAF